MMTYDKEFSYPFVQAVITLDEMRKGTYVDREAAERKRAVEAAFEKAKDEAMENISKLVSSPEFLSLLKTDIGSPSPCSLKMARTR